MTERERIDAMAQLLVKVGESLGRLSAAMQALSAQNAATADVVRLHSTYLTELHAVMNVEQHEPHNRLDGYWGNPN